MVFALPESSCAMRLPISALARLRRPCRQGWRSGNRQELPVLQSKAIMLFPAGGKLPASFATWVPRWDYFSAGGGGSTYNLKIKVKVKGSGQECPLHTGKSSTRSK